MWCRRGRVGCDPAEAATPLSVRLPHTRHRMDNLMRCHHGDLTIWQSIVSAAAIHRDLENLDARNEGPKNGVEDIVNFLGGRHAIEHKKPVVRVTPPRAHPHAPTTTHTPRSSMSENTAVTTPPAFFFVAIACCVCMLYALSLCGTTLALVRLGSGLWSLFAQPEGRAYARLAIQRRVRRLRKVQTGSAHAGKGAHDAAIDEEETEQLPPSWSCSSPSISMVIDDYAPKED